jgi:hypothetical protein
MGLLEGFKTGNHFKKLVTIVRGHMMAIEKSSDHYIFDFTYGKNLWSSSG